MGHLQSLVLPLVLLASDHADSTKVAVDVELVLAADTSSSMDVEERQAQVDGYANAFRDGALIAKLLSGPTGRIAVTYVEWSEEQRVIVPWTLISNVHEAERFAAAIADAPVYHDLHGTNITGALKFSAAALLLNQFDGRRSVIDISGDGENNFRLPPDPVRDAIVQEGITINGLSLELREDKKKDWRNEPTASYYAAHVIGGPGAFLVSAYGMGDFEEALKRKLVLEMLAGSDQSLPVRPSTLAGEQTSASGRHPSWQMLKQVAASGTTETYWHHAPRSGPEGSADKNCNHFRCMFVS